MKNYILFISFLLTLASCQVSVKTDEDRSKQPEAISKEEALDLLHRWTKAYLEGDSTSLDDILDETWLYAGSSDGKTTDKKTTIEEFSTADYKFSDISYENLEVNLYGDVAVVRGSETMVILGNEGKDTTQLSLRFTDVYQKKNGKVRAVSTHSSPID